MVAFTARVALAIALLSRMTAGQVRPAVDPLKGLEVFEIAPTHSQVEFRVPFMGLASVKGAFEEFSGTLLLDEKNPSRSSVTVVIQTASIHTGNAARDKHLESDDFFDVDRFPTIIFQSDTIQRRRQGGYAAIGRLTMHGVTRVITLPFRVRHAVVRDPSGVDLAGFDVETKLDWRAFGIAATNKNNSWFQPARMLVNDSVAITLSIEADRRRTSRLHYSALDAALAAVNAEGVSRYLERFAAIRADHPDSVARFARPLSDLGRALVELGRSRDAVAILRANVDAFPENAAFYTELAAAYFANDQRDSAIAAHRQALALDPTQSEAIEVLRRLGIAASASRP